MAEFRVFIDIAAPPGGALTRDAFPHVAHSLMLLAERGVEIWREYASGAALPGGGVIRARSGAYMRSIHRIELGEFAHEVLSELPYAKVIEDGAPARDMKTMLNTSLKVRVGKDGSRYLIIPFRHGTPGTTGFRSTMSDDAYVLARAMKPSRVTGMSQRQSGTGAYDIRTRRAIMVSQRTYHWGDRLTARQLADAGIHGRAKRHMTGMVKMQNPGSDGGSRHTQYMTFRVMSEKSKGWLMPAREGLQPARTTSQRLAEVAPKLIGEALKRDVEAFLGRGA